MSHSYRLRDWSDAERSFWVTASTANPIKCEEPGPKIGGDPVEYWESLEGWDFSRYEKNPLVFEAHATDDSDAVIGTGSDFRETEDGGLEMKVTLLPVSANARTQVLESRIKAGALRGVSVGWDRGTRSDEKRGGKEVRVYRKNKLCEVSLVPLPKDEDGLVEAEPMDPEEQRREKASNAARELARHRYNRTDAAGGEERRFDFLGSLGKFTRTQVGGIRVPARLTRTGVLEYRKPDGTIRRELRLPEEVFNADSLATLQDATVVNIDNHRTLLSAENWRDATLGHTVNVRQDGKFVGADLLINDAGTVRAIETGELHDISCGYSCKLDMTSGVFEGQPYDAIQRHIRYNHVAVLPKGRGRAGTDVALRLDAKDAVCVEAETTIHGEPTMTTKIIRLDGKDVEYGSEQHINHLETSHKTALAAINAQLSEVQVKCDKAEAGKDAATKAQEKAEKEKAEAAERSKVSMRNRRALERKLLRAYMESDDETDKDEEKMDAKMDALGTERDVMLAFIRTDADWANNDFKDKPDAYVEAIFAVVEKKKEAARAERTDSVDDVVDKLERIKRADGNNTESPEAKAKAKMQQRSRDAWTKPLTA